MGNFKVDTRAFEAALKDTLAYTSREFPKVINSTAIEVITEAAKATYKANPEAIEKALTTGSVSVSTLTKSGKLSKPKTYYRPTPLVYKIINARQTAKGQPGLNNRDMSIAAQKLIRQRRAACGYTAYAGWQKALQAFSGRGFGGREKQVDGKSSAGHGYGIPARAGALFAKMVNTAAAIEIYGVEPLQRAINAKTAKMIQHLDEKLSGKFKQVSRR